MSEFTTALRTRLTHVVEAQLTQRLIIALILLNALTLGLETSSAVMAFAAR
jgi:voltage-gated sodium channel